MIVIIGGSPLAENLIVALSKLKRKIVFLMKDKETAMELSSRTGAIGVCGDPSDPEDLDEVEIGKASVVIAATSREDTNVLVALYAKEKGAKEVIAELNTPHAASLLQKAEIIPVAADVQAAKMIEMMVSRPGIAKLVSMGEGGLDMIEVPAKSTRFLWKKFGDVKGNGFRSVAVYSNGELSVDEDEKLREGSTLVILCPSGSAEKVRKSLA